MSGRQPGNDNGITVTINPDNMEPTNASYSLSGRIMLSAIVLLFAVVVLMVCLHIYARWYLHRAHQIQLRRRRRRSNRTHLVFYSEPNSAASRGLDAAVLGSIPVSLYTPETHPEVLECAVCLSEFEQNDKLRVLPKCKHGFHLDCIDMWFHSHSTCPLCRSPVEAVVEFRDCVISFGEPGEAGTGSTGSSSSGLCDTCQQDREHGSSSRNRPSQQTHDTLQARQLGERRKGIELERITIELPRRNESGDVSRLSSPASQGLRSPMGTRLMSLTRLLSLNTKGGGVSPSSSSSGVGTSCVAELDVECGMNESTQFKSRVQTPR